MSHTDRNLNEAQERLLSTTEKVLAALGGVLVPCLILCMMAGLWTVLEVKHQRRLELAAAVMPRPVKLDASAYARGQQLYTMACLACHGPNGTGVNGLGKDLVKSRFSHGLSDTQLAAFIIAGRGVDDPSNTTRIPMPPRGGRADFSDQNIGDVVTFLRGLADPRRAPEGPLPAVEVVLSEPPVVPAALQSAAPAPMVMVDASTPAVSAAAMQLDPQAVARGKRAFISCMACHGKDGRGVKNMGKDLVNSTFVASLSDPALVDFIKKGRGPTDPANTTKIGMPPKGGNPALKDEQVSDIVAYIRSLKAPGAPAAAAVSAVPVATPKPLPSVAATPAAPTAAVAVAPVAPIANVAVAPSPTPTPVKVAVVPTGDAIARGKRAFVSCMACHGKDASGVKNMGKDLVHSPFVASLSDQALIDFIKKGRGPTDPGNTTKIGMPPKGGNPALKDEQISDIVAYLRSLRQSAQTE